MVTYLNHQLQCLGVERASFFLPRWLLLVDGTYGRAKYRERGDVTSYARARSPIFPVDHKVVRVSNRLLSTREIWCAKTEQL
jgi:hypothetical protein